MAKRAAYLHIGLPHSGAERIDAALHEHAEAFTASGVVVASRSVDEMFRAAVELRREHKAWGLRRKDVEGVWAAVCRRVAKGRYDVVVGHPLLAGATEPEIDLLVDRLAGFTVHVVVTVGTPDARLSAFPDDHDLADVLRRWGRVTSPDRVHVVVAGPTDAHLDAAWAAFGDVVQVDTHGLALPAALPGQVDTRALRLIAEGTASLAGADDLAAAVDEWAKLVADRGYDVRGDLSALTATATGAADDDDSLSVTALADALSDTLAEVTRLRARALELEKDNTRLTRKKRQLKHRLAGLG